MIEVDWQELFNSFFNTVRVKIQCKDSTRIPRERIFVFKSNVHLIVFTPEGYEQAKVSDGGSDKGGGEENKGEDPLEDDLSASGKGGSNSPKEKSKEKEKDQSSTLPQGNKSAPAGNKCVRRLLQFDDAEFDNQAQTLECANLLKAMELDEEEGLVEELEDNFDTLIQEDDETCQLPEEWVFNITEDRVGSQSSSQIDFTMGIVSDLTKGRETDKSEEEIQALEEKVQQRRRGSKKQQWGPIVQTRRSTRNIDNGKTMMEKA
jgi:hypothetical protein